MRILDWRDILVRMDIEVVQPRLSVQTESGLIAASLRSQLTGLIGWRGGNLQPGVWSGSATRTVQLLGE
ncbi:hypothetical protein M5E82_12945 [Parabacteroides distasonis]|nr:hypothetical protein M5E82_12945 [Parabacteroides distasonis]